VLPFKNISSDKEQEYFCDGMTEAIITDLSKLGQLVVMSPSAVFHYKGEPFDYRKIRNELQVQYVLEGSIQRSGREIRVSAQLTNAETGVQLWAERFDRPIRDVFSVQDDISHKIIDVLKLKLSAVDQRQLEGHPTENLEAYDLYLRGRYHYNRRNVKDTDIAIPLLERSTSIDPKFAEAFAVLGQHIPEGILRTTTQERVEGKRCVCGKGAFNKPEQPKHTSRKGTCLDLCEPFSSMSRPSWRIDAR
jgi:adenylate cyclase